RPDHVSGGAAPHTERNNCCRRTLSMSPSGRLDIDQRAYGFDGRLEEAPQRTNCERAWHPVASLQTIVGVNRLHNSKREAVYVFGLDWCQHIPWSLGFLPRAPASSRRNVLPCLLVEYCVSSGKPD